MILNNNELFCLIEILEEKEIYPIEIEKISVYLVNEGYIRDKEDMLGHIIELYDLKKIPIDWLDINVILQEEGTYQQIGDDCFINIFYLDDDIEELKSKFLNESWIRKNIK